VVDRHSNPNVVALVCDKVVSELSSLALTRAVVVGPVEHLGCDKWANFAGNIV
jgi:hypothetical protein